ncbi:hypothetical protein DCD74_10130 [Lysobacter oculi]|uniref:Peptidase S74 domain-containing protein n=1 Tax=Solilutibacter oculi TaxID=2698682 RepID=A0A344J7H9_9GAMM|nr:hypothetical protein [Lysobacter oculi]AXA84989.1 hypothetical protein DCD74_10130 [Lysobacter oculi]
MKTAKHNRVMMAALVIGSAPVAAMANEQTHMPEAFGGMSAETVDDAELAGVTGKYYGANMLVGVRVDLVSHWRGTDGTDLSASAAVQIQRDGNGGYQVSIDTHSQASAGSGAVAGNPGGATASGQTLQVAGISQLSQIAGDDNRVGNLATIGVVSKLPGVSGFNGQSSTTTTQGAYQAQVSFVGGGLQMGLLGPDSQVTQRLGANGPDGGISQAARIAGNGQIAQNQMAMQVQVAPMSQALQQQLGVQQALSSLLALRR